MTQERADVQIERRGALIRLGLDIALALTLLALIWPLTPWFSV